VSDFQVSAVQRRRLLEGHYGPLEFDTKPWVESQGRCVEPGDRYVLAWARASATAYKSDDDSEAFVARIPRHPVWFLTVRSVKRRRQGGWLVRFDVTDRRDRDLWLSRSGNYQSTARGAVDVLPVAPSDEVRARAQAEFWHQRRLAEHAKAMRERSKARTRRRKAA
jgi:hypothetical protein